jgi:hypothetical protein
MYAHAVYKRLHQENRKKKKDKVRAGIFFERVVFPEF